MSALNRLEIYQIRIYFSVVILAALAGLAFPEMKVLDIAINPALALMMFFTFLQIPLADLARAILQGRFLLALLVTNFILIPILVFWLVQFLPDDPIIKLGVALVLLAPCIDYVVTFSYLGRADARLLLAATPMLLIGQILLLPIYLSALLGDAARDLIQLDQFLRAFVWLIAAPLVLAIIMQKMAGHMAVLKPAINRLAQMPVPATALVLFIVVAAVVPQLGGVLDGALRVVPIYLGYAVLAPFVGGGCAYLLKLEPPASRAVAFSAGTRNSLVVLPLAFAVPQAVPLLPAIIVTQTLIELLSELIYIRVIPRIMPDKT